MIKIIDNFLNKITMYRLVVYELLFLLLVSAVLGLFGILPYNPLLLAFSVVFIFIVCWLTNKILAWLFKLPSNPESIWITSFILALIITPSESLRDSHFLLFSLCASVIAVASKYILAIRGKHIFNPAAIGVALPSFFLGISASWWIGAPIMVPSVLIAGLLVVRKIRRFDLWLSFIAVFVIGIISFNFAHQSSWPNFLIQSLFFAPPFFFATVMLTEPATTPPTRWLRISYGLLVGIFFLPNFHIASFYFTPELALVAGNIFSFLVSPKYKLKLKLNKTDRLSSDVYGFSFIPEHPISYKPGQYMELTLAHDPTDTRSVRRYFTLASSPTEKEIKIGVKFYEPTSTFKKSLLEMGEGEELLAGQLSGDFTLPEDKNKKMVFIAGGIGITPFRSMIKYLLDNKEVRPVTLMYSNKTPTDVVYADIFTEAAQNLGIKTIYAFTDKNISLPVGAIPIINAEMIKQEVPDYQERMFYISGPQGMVTAFREILLQMGIARSHIKTDYFPGFA